MKYVNVRVESLVNNKQDIITASFKDVVSKIINHKGFLDSDTNLKIILKLLPLFYKYDSIVPIEVAEETITNVWNKLQTDPTG